MRDRRPHDKELLAGLLLLNTADALPHLIRVEDLALVHQQTRRLWEKQHADTHDGREEQRGPQDPAPVSGHAQEDGGDGVPKNLAEGNVELVQGDEVAADSALHRLGDVHGDGAALETDAETEDDAAGDDHAVVDGTSFEGRADGVEDDGDHDGPPAAEALVDDAEREGAAYGSEGHAAGH